MFKARKNKKNSFKRKSNTIGIIPITTNSNLFGMPYLDCLMPLYEKHTILHNAIYDCVEAGCVSIWIICNAEVKPVLQHMFGNEVRKEKRSRSTESERIRFIPIYYAILPPYDNIFVKFSTEMAAALEMTRLLTLSQKKHLNKAKLFYIRLPFAMVRNPEPNKFKNLLNPFALSFRGANISDGLMLPFALSLEQAKKLRRRHKILFNDVRQGKNTEIKDFFKNLDMKVFKDIPVKDYYPMNSWSEYVEAISKSYWLSERDPGTFKKRDE